MKTNPDAVDAVIVLPATPREQSTIPDMLRRAFDYMAELAAKNELEPPLAISLFDSGARCLIAMEITVYCGKWDGRIDGKPLETRGGIALPWFVVAEDRNGRTLKIRVDPCEQSEQIN